MSHQELLSLEDLDSFLADRLFTVVSQGQDRVTFDQLVIAKANCLKVPCCALDLAHQPH